MCCVEEWRSLYCYVQTKVSTATTCTISPLIKTQGWSASITPRSHARTHICAHTHTLNPQMYEGISTFDWGSLCTNGTSVCGGMIPGRGGFDLSGCLTWEETLKDGWQRLDLLENSVARRRKSSPCIKRSIKPSLIRLDSSSDCPQQLHLKLQTFLTEQNKRLASNPLFFFFLENVQDSCSEHRRRWRARWNKRENRQRKRWKFSLQREYRRWDVLIKSKRNTLLPETCLKVCRFGFVCLLLPLPVPKISDFIFII